MPVDSFGLKGPVKFQTGGLFFSGNSNYNHATHENNNQ